jgi:hypothetical protein
MNIKQITTNLNNLLSEKSELIRLFLAKKTELQKLLFFVMSVVLLTSAFLGGSVVANVSMNVLPTSFLDNSSKQVKEYQPSQGIGNENLNNSSKDTLKNFIEILKENLKKSDGFFNAVFSERPLFLSDKDILINGSSFTSPKATIYPASLGIAYSLVTLFIIFDVIKLLIGHGGNLEKLFFKYLLGFLIVSLSGLLLNYSIDMANAITKDLVMNNNINTSQSSIGKILNDYLTNVQESYKPKTEWPWDFWFGDKAVWNPINVLRDYFSIALELLPLIALLVVVLMNAFALLTNWVIMYVLSGIVPIAVAFYMVDWNHAYTRNFLNLWVQNLLQLPLFTLVFSVFVGFLGGGIGSDESFKLALFFAFLCVMLNVNQNFGSIFTGFTSQAGNVASSLFAGMGTSAVSTVGSGTLRAMGKGGFARQVAGGAGTQAMKMSSNFSQGVKTGSGAGFAGRAGQSVNSFGQGLVGKRTSSYVANRLGRVAGSTGVGNSNLANALLATGQGVSIAKTKATKAVKTTTQAVSNLKTDPKSPSRVGLNPVKNGKYTKKK